MNRDYINWLETLPSNRKPQKVNTSGRHCLKRLICLLTRIGRIARISGIPRF